MAPGMTASTQRSALRGVALPAPWRPAVRAPGTARPRTVRVAARKLDKRSIKKVVLAYSGGLDTSVILKWLQDTYDCEVVTFTADLGQVRADLRSSGCPACLKSQAAAVPAPYWNPSLQQACCAMCVVQAAAPPLTRWSEHATTRTQLN